MPRSSPFISTIDDTKDTPENEILSDFIKQFYSDNNEIPKEILTEYKIDDEEANPLNDGYSNSLMFERHYTNIRFKSYRREYAVVQRSDNFNAKENQMFDIIANFL